MRRIYRYMDAAEKQEAIRAFQRDIKELQKELANEYPRVVRDAIEETIRRYTQEVAYLKREVHASGRDSGASDGTGQ